MLILNLDLLTTPEPFTSHERYSHITVQNAEVMVFDSDDSIPGVGMTYAAVSGVEIGMPRHISTKRMTVVAIDGSHKKSVKPENFNFAEHLCIEPTVAASFRNAPTETDNKNAADPTQRGQNEAVLAQYRRDKWTATVASRNYLGVWPMFRRHGPMGLNQGVCKCQGAPKPHASDNAGLGVKAGDMVETEDKNGRWSPQPRFAGKVFAPFNRLLSFATMANYGPATCQKGSTCAPCGNNPFRACGHFCRGSGCYASKSDDCKRTEQCYANSFSVICTVWE